MPCAARIAPPNFQGPRRLLHKYLKPWTGERSTACGEGPYK